MTRLLSAIRTDPARVQAEVAEEIADHLRRLTDELESRGLSAADAAAEARRRFGDAGRVARRCESIMLKERTMLRKLHLALTITLAALLVVTITMGISAAARARAEAVRAREMEMQARMEAERSRDAAEQARVKMEGQPPPARPE